MSVTAHTNDRIWTRQTSGWGDLIRGEYQNAPLGAIGVSGVVEYLLATPAREAAGDMLAVLETYVADEWAHMDDGELARELSLGNEMVRNVIAARAVIAKAKGGAA